MIPAPPITCASALIPPPPPAFAAATATGRAGPLADVALARLVADAEAQVSAVLSSGYAVGLDVLGDIVLPPGAETQVERAQMRALGALYLAADLEPARVIASAEALAALAATGAVNVDLGGAAPLLHRFWRERNERIDAAERAAFFGRLFGGSYGPAPADNITNAEFESLMLDLCEALYRLDELRGGIAQQTRVRAAARNLIANLVAAGGGVTPYLAAGIIKTLKEALAILGHEHLRGVFMARDIWGVIAGINRLARKRTVEPRVFVRRGRAGMTIIVWLADAAETMAQHGRPPVTLDHPVIPAAVDWLQASLTISERQDYAGQNMPAQSPAGTGYAPAQVPQWADIGI